MRKSKQKGDKLQVISVLLRQLKKLAKEGFISEKEASQILTNNLDLQMKLHLGRDA